MFAHKILHVVLRALRRSDQMTSEVPGDQAGFYLASGDASFHPDEPVSESWLLESVNWDGGSHWWHITCSPSELPTQPHSKGVPLISWEARCPTQPSPPIWEVLAVPTLLVVAHLYLGWQLILSLLLSPSSLFVVGKIGRPVLLWWFNFVLRITLFSLVEKDKAILWGWSKTILLPGYLFPNLTFALLYLERL